MRPFSVHSLAFSVKIRRVKKRWLILCPAVGAMLLAALLGPWHKARITSYQGRTIQAWALQYYRGQDQPKAEARAAFEAMDTKALPELIRLLETNDALWRRLAWEHAARLPMPLRRFIVQRTQPPEAMQSREAAARCLQILGPKAQPAIPNLIRALGLRGTHLCVEAALALGRIGKPALPRLMTALQSRDWCTRQWSACAVGEIGPDAKDAIPVLIPLLLHDREVSLIAATAAGKIGAASVPSLIECLKETSSDVLVNTMLALGEIGPESSAALPTLRRIEQDRDTSPKLRKAATDAIRQIQID